MTGLPAGWQLRCLSEIAHITLGQSPPSASYNTAGLGLPFFQGKAEFGDLYPDVRKYTTAGTKFAEPGDILLSVRAPVGPTNLAPTRCAIGRGLAAVRAGDAVDARYLLWALRALEDRLAAMGAGSTFAAVTAKQVRELQVPLAPRAEQTRIVEILEDHLSRLDAANDYLEAAAARATIARRSSAAAAVQEAEGYADTRQATLAELARVGSGTTPRRGHAPYWLDGSVPWITSGEIAQGVIASASQHVTELALAETALKLWPAGTLLVAMYGEGKTRGTVGELAIPATTNQACAAILLNDNDETSRAWTRLVLGARYESMRRSSSGGVQPNLTLGFFKALTLPWPSKPTMMRLIAAHEELTQRTAQASQAIGTAQGRARALRRALLAAAFSGRLTGRSSDLDLAEELVVASRVPTP